MQRTAFRFAKHVPRIFGTRRLSTSLRQTDTARPIGTKHFVEYFYKETQDPLWRVVDALRSLAGRREELPKGPVPEEELAEWEHVISHLDIGAAVSHLEQLGYPVRPPLNPDINLSSTGRQIPTWVILYLVGYKVRTSAHAQGPLLDFVYSQLDSAPVEIHGPLLILTTFSLARFNLLIPTRRVLDTFLNTPLLQDPGLQFNLLLQALSYIQHRSAENANNVVAILKAMEARQLKLRSQTYEALLNDRFVTLQLTKFLHQRMIQEGFVPSASHLEAYLRIFAKNGIIHNAQQYFEIIHATTKGPPSDQHAAEDPRLRANTLLLNALDKRASAFEFLRSMKEANSGQATSSHLPAARREVRFVHKTNSDIYEETAALNVAAKDLSTSTALLLKLFQGIKSKRSAATYTVLIQGLLLRREFTRAETYWNRLAMSGVGLDNHSLTAGLQAYIRSGKPDIAFQILETYALKPGQDSSGSKTKRPLVRLNTVSMNEFLVALKRISRPDAVFRLWDYMGTLYEVYPNTQTLSILLQSARLAFRMDDTLSGALAHLKLFNPFKRRQAPTPEVSRDGAVAAIVSVLGHPKQDKVDGYRSGIWQDQLPLEFARKIFLQALFGMDTEGRLGGVRSPANAIRDSYEDDASPGIGLPRLGPKEYVFEPPSDLLTPAGKSHYPHIVVSNANCFNYITLLGIGSRVAEIPLVLAWMRALGLQPSNSTLAVALVFWAEVSVQAPLVEKWSGGPEQNEYAKLVDWLRDWVGERRLPHWRTLQKWQDIVHRMRTTAEEVRVEDGASTQGSKEHWYRPKRPVRRYATGSRRTNRESE
ncbi:hypothetical protein NLJ89_g5762 [Agrocybe chaxingu]|uniref:Uncharacterized protein n=1 Tax=Agrocybe chaxingu TaxID=84603 RepID=A0A9W8K0F3_9AGAR|nr:hypothetical protein NLJ89_g5762 [Agrocybe chaxingu]